ncbi:hypothetical protein KAT63_02695 [Candidatus Parcubacteria bacterium]|nr:hypothetical protein [Candidatus Parcubacteria bacterium]
MNKKIKVNLKEIVFSNEEGKSFCDIFVYEPENIEEQSLGNLYIVGEIVNFSENSSYLINLLASIAKKEFYSNSKKSTMEGLEASLHKINSTLSDLAEQGNVDWIGNLNMTYCAYKNGELHLSQAGKIKTVLIRDGQITDIGKNITNEEKPHPFKTFTNIANGELENGDLVLFATPELFNVFSMDKLKQLASSLNIEELAEIIQDSIEKEDDIRTMGLLLMKIEEEKEEKLPHIEIKPQIENVKKEEAIPVLQERLENPSILGKKDKEEVPQPVEKTEPETSRNEEKLSLEDIINKYEKEEELPDDIKTREGGKEEIKEALNLSKENYQDEKKVEVENKDKENEADDFMDSLDEKSGTKVEYLLEKLKKIFIITKNKIIFPAFKFAKNSALKLKSVFSKKSEPGDEFPQQVKLSQNRKKLILAAFISIALILAGGLIFKNYKDSENEKFNTYADLLIQAEGKVKKAEIDSIGNQPEARKSLIEARNIINTRDFSLDNRENYKDLFDKIAALLEEIQKQLDIIDLVNRIENSAVAIDFSQIENVKNPEKIFEDNGKYYVFDLENKALNKINFTEKNLDDLKIEAGNNINFNSLSTLMKRTEEVMFITDSDKIGIFNIGKKAFSSADIEFLGNISDIKDIDSYGNFIYLLDSSSNQIYKYKRSTNGFDKGEGWFEDNFIRNIKNATSMAIDGSIYLLNSNGLIDKFNRAKAEIKQSFSIEIPSDPISSSAKIYTKPGFEYLYVIDSDKNRVVLFDKISGKLAGQYISNEFSNLKNIIVDEKEEKMHILSGDKVLEVVIEIEN